MTLKGRPYNENFRAVDDHNDHSGKPPPYEEALNFTHARKKDVKCATTTPSKFIYISNLIHIQCTISLKISLKILCRCSQKLRKNMLISLST